MKRIRLGVNIDHVATVRNARGEQYPSPLRAALLAEKNGADSVTIHLREDRRHINEFDLKQIKKMRNQRKNEGNSHRPPLGTNAGGVQGHKKDNKKDNFL